MFTIASLALRLGSYRAESETARNRGRSDECLDAIDWLFEGTSRVSHLLLQGDHEPAASQNGPGSAAR